MRKIGLLVLCVSVSAAIGCGGSSGGGYITGPGGGNTVCPDNTICMTGSTFSPASLTVAAGTIVSFTNNSGVLHHPVFDAPVAPGVTDIGDISSGTVNRTFSKSGTWNFHCTIHAGMAGSVTVP
jgi:plastocyanin